MSKELNEFPAQDLRNELARRERSFRAGLCWYCRRRLVVCSKEPCKMVGVKL